MARNLIVALNPEKKNILIIGASFAGISTAHYLLKHVVPKLPSPSSYQIILIGPSVHAMCRQACPRALVSDEFFDQDKLFVDIQEQFTQYPKEKFRFIHGFATYLDHVNRKLVVRFTENETQESMPYHTLILATGASTPSPLLGFNRGDRNTLHSAWTQFRKALPSAKSIVISGGGPSGIETAAELGEYLNGRAGWFASSLCDPKVKITVISAGDKIIPALRPSLAKNAELLLKKVGVQVMTSTRVVSVEPSLSGTTMETLTMNTKVKLSTGKVLDTDIYIPAIGTRPNTSFVPEAFLAEDACIQTNPNTLRVDKAGPLVYAVGDCSNAFRPAVHNILAAIPILCSNIKRDLLIQEGQEVVGEDRIFKEDKRETQLVPIGKNGGVGAAMGWALPGWMVWLIKGRDYWLWTMGRLWSGEQWAKES